MVVRNKRRCRNCPDNGAPMPQQSQIPSSSGPQTATLQISSESEGKRLWHHALFGAGACVSMIEGYCQLDMPGAPHDAIQALVIRLQNVLKKIEAKNEIPSTPQRSAPDQSDRKSGPMVEKEVSEPDKQGVRDTDSSGNQSGRSGGYGRGLRRHGPASRSSDNSQDGENAQRQAGKSRAGRIAKTKTKTED